VRLFERLEQRRREAEARGPLSREDRERIREAHRENAGGLAKHKRWLRSGGAADPGKVSKLEKKLRRMAGI